MISSLRSPWTISLQSTSNVALGLLSNLYATVLSCFTFWGTCIPVQSIYGCGKDCLYDSHFTQTVTEQLLHSSTTSNASPLFQTVALMWGSDSCFSFPTPQVQIQSFSLSSVFPPSFVLPSFARFYIFFSCGQVLLPNLGWYYERPSVFESVLLMYPWPPTAPPS